MSAIRKCWASRWGMARLIGAAWLLVVLVADNPSRLARLQLDRLPTADYVAEARKLAVDGRFGEALVVVDAGLADDDVVAQDALREEKESIEAQRDSVLRKLCGFGKGAVFGTGESMEELAGAIAADVVVVGDVRDLLLESTKQMTGEGADGLIVTLSAVGLATTVAPHFDAAAAFLKLAKKAGALSNALARALTTQLKKVLKLQDFSPVKGFFSGLDVMMDRLSGGGTLRLLRHIDDPKEVEAVAGFLKSNRAGGYALNVAGKEGLDAVRRGAGDTLVIAAKKGQSGIAWIRTSGRHLLKPHPLLGVAKGVYKGTIGKFADRVVRNYLDPGGKWLIASLCGWVVLESMLLWHRLWWKVPPAIGAA